VGDEKFQFVPCENAFERDLRVQERWKEPLVFVINLSVFALPPEIQSDLFVWRIRK